MKLKSTEHFSEEELKCRCGACEYPGMDSTFLTDLEGFRKVYGKPLVVLSGYRCPEYNNKISRTGRTGPHTTGQAVDVLVSGEDAYNLLDLAFVWEFSGIGIKQNGPYEGRFVHLDDFEDEEFRPRVWTYG